MIMVTLDRRAITLSGHAPRPQGSSENLVCAAVSALTQSLIDGLEEIANMKLEDLKLESGDVSFRWRRTTPAGATLIQSWELSMERISESYPGTMTITRTWRTTSH